MKNRSLLASVCATSVCAMTGCSFIFMERPTPEHRVCNEQFEAPTADTVIALGAAAVVAGLWIEGAATPQGDNGDPYAAARLVTLPAIPLFVVNGFSALWGWDTRRMCRQSRERAQGLPVSSVR